jgi:hypothetical protein
MDDLLAMHLLADKHRCGVFRVHPEAQPAPSPLMRLKPLATERLDHDGLLDALAKALDFPAYFGRNWDAAWDCLTELSWPSDQLLVLSLPIDAETSLEAGDLRLFFDLINDACGYWAQRGRGLCLLVASEPGDLPALEKLPWLA